MATEDFILTEAGVYYPLADAEEEFYASNSSSFSMHLRSSATKPADKLTGHPVHPSRRIERPEVMKDALWIMCMTAGAKVCKN